MNRDEFNSGQPCPDCGSPETAKVGDCLRCFRCGSAWPAYGPEDDGLTDPDPLIELATAVDRIMSADLDDPGDDLDRVEAEIEEDVRRGVAAFAAGPVAWAAWEAEMLGLDDDDADIIAASMTPPGSRSRVEGVWTP